MSREGRSDDKLVCTGQGDVVNQIRSVIPLARVRAQAPLLSPRACRATPSLTRDGPVEGRRVRAHAARRMDIAHTPPQKPYLKHDSQSVSIHVSSTQRARRCGHVGRLLSARPSVWRRTWTRNLFVSERLSRARAAPQTLATGRAALQTVLGSPSNHLYAKNLLQRAGIGV